MNTGEEQPGGVEADRHAEERAWLALIASGGSAGNAAMKALLDRYQLPFRTYLRYRWFTDADISDVTQRVWIDVARKAQTFRSAEVPEAWLWGFLRTAMLAARRSGAQYASRFTSANDDASNELSIDDVVSPSPEVMRSVRDLRDCVNRAFSAFKRQHPHEAWWMYLRHADDWDLDQVARYRGSSRHAAVEFLSRARKMFRDFVAPCLELRAD